MCNLCKFSPFTIIFYLDFLRTERLLRSALSTFTTWRRQISVADSYNLGKHKQTDILAAAGYFSEGHLDERFYTYVQNSKCNQNS